VLEFLGEERSLLSHGDVHKVAKESAVLDRAGKGCLGGFRSSAIAHHLPQPFAQGLEPGSENVGAPRDGDGAAHLQHVLLYDRLLPRLVAQGLQEQVRDDAALSQAERRAGDRGGVDHAVSLSGGALSKFEEIPRGKPCQP